MGASELEKKLSKDKANLEGLGADPVTDMDSEGGGQAHTVNGDDYKSAIRLIKQLYKKARLVHGDFSEYNIFKTENGLVLFDLGSAVDLEHPNAHEFLKRDIENISNFFVRRGLTVKNPIDIINEVTK